MKKGDKFNATFVLDRPAESGELMPDVATGKVFEIDNRKGNLWWAHPFGGSYPRFLVCTDELDILPPA